MASLIQAVPATTATLTGPIGVTLAPTGPGNCLIVCFGTSASPGNPTISGITLGGAAGNFAQVIAPVGNPTSASNTGFMWADPGCAGGQTALSIAITPTTDSGSADVIVMEWSGIVPSSPVDKTNGQPGTASSSWSSLASGTTTQSNEVVIGCVLGFNASGIGSITGPTSPWTNLTQETSASAHFGLLVGYQVVSSISSFTYSGSFAASSDYAAIVATFFATAALAPPPQPQQLGGPKYRRRRYRIQRQVTNPVCESGSLTIVVPTLTTSLTGVVVHKGSLAVTVPTLVTAISGKVAHQGSLAITLPKPVVTLTGAPVHTGSLAILLPTLVPALTGTDGHAGALAITVPTVQTSLSGLVTIPSPVQQPGGAAYRRFHYRRQQVVQTAKTPTNFIAWTLPPPSVSLSGVVTHYGALSIVLPLPLMPLAGNVIIPTHSGALIIILPPGCRSILESGLLNIYLPPPVLNLQGKVYHGQLNIVLPAPLIYNWLGVVQLTESGALALTIPTVVTNIVGRVGRETGSLQLNLPTVSTNLNGVVVHNGVLLILFLNCGSMMLPLTRYEMFGCESRGDLVLEVPRPILQLEAQLVREKQIPMASWARAKQARTARRRQIKGARLAAQERQKLREDDDQDGS